MTHSFETWTTLKEVMFKCYETVRKWYSFRHIMILYNKFNDWFNQRDNCISKYRNNMIALDIEVIIKCENIHHDERRNARRVQRNQWCTDIMKQRDLEQLLEEFHYHYYF